MARRFAVILAVALAVLPGASRAEAPLRLRIAWAAVPGQLAPVLYQKQDLLKHYGKSYIVEPVRVPGSGQQLTALAANELEIAQFAPAAFALALQNAHMDDLRIIGDATRDGHEDYHTRKFAVLADGPIHTVEDLEGKVIGSNSIGGAMDMAFRNFMLAHRLDDRHDYSVVEIGLANEAGALAEHKIDLAFLTTPFEFAPLRTGKARVLFTMKDAMGGESELSIMTARAPLIAAHRAAFVDYFEDTERAMRWMVDPKNRAEAIAIIANFTKEPEADFAGWIFTKDDDYHPLDSRPDLTAIQQNIDVQRRLGLLKLDIAVKDYADLSLIDEAAKRLQ